MAREKEKRPVWQRAAVIGITSIVLLVPFGLYYLFYVLAQQNYFIDRSHRSLEGIGDQITSRIDGLSDVVEKAATKGCPGEASDLTGYFKSLKPFGVSLKLEPQPASSEDEPDALVRATDKPPVSVEF